MKVQERSRQEIQAKLAKMGDYVKIDYLQRALGSGLDFDSRKFALVELSKLYESKGMYSEAGKMIKNAAEINTTFKAKMQDYMKSVELYVRGGLYQDADFVFAQALALATDREKPELKVAMKNFYMTNARAYLKADKRTPARKIYEKLLTLDLNPSEKQEVQKELLVLYEKLGAIRDYYKLKEGM